MATRIDPASSRFDGRLALRCPICLPISCVCERLPHYCPASLAPGRLRSVLRADTASNGSIEDHLSGVQHRRVSGALATAWTKTPPYAAAGHPPNVGIFQRRHCYVDYAGQKLAGSQTPVSASTRRNQIVGLQGKSRRRKKDGDPPAPAQEEPQLQSPSSRKSEDRHARDVQGGRR